MYYHCHEEVFGEMFLKINIRIIAITLLLVWAFNGCAASDEKVIDDVEDTGSTDSDTDTDNDADADSDTDGDSDSDSDAGISSGFGCEAMDILFIIDDSASMTAEQDELVTAFPKFMEVLDQYNLQTDRNIQYHVGVSTVGCTRTYKGGSQTGPDGALYGKNECALDDAWINGPSDDMVSQFGCAAHVGTNGTGHEMPFAALEGARVPTRFVAFT
jgi:hypothetical protein